VVLQLGSVHPSAIALEAAVRIAQAFQSEIESVFVEDEQLFDCAAYNFVREVSLSGRHSRAVSAAAMTQGLRLAAQGAPFDQATAARLAGLPGFGLVAGRYEGIDQRVSDALIDEELSIGDYVLSGGEFPALIVIDAVARLLPGVLGNEESAVQESHGDGLLDWPHYTRPEVWDGRPVPPVLLGGNHAAIRRWRMMQALGRTWQRRPDLLARRRLTADERAMLEEYCKAAGVEPPR